MKTLFIIYLLMIHIYKVLNLKIKLINKINNFINNNYK